MRIERIQRSWLVLGLLGTGLPAFGYLARHLAGPESPGRALCRLALGVTAAALLVLVSLLGMRRQLGKRALGTAASWLRAHIWLALLAFLLSLAHGGFRLGSPLTFALTLCLGICVASGIVGFVLQRLLPTLMADVGDAAEAASLASTGDPALSISLLRSRAYQLIWAACGHPPDAENDAEVVAEREAIRALVGALPSAPDRASLLEPMLGQQKLARSYRRIMLPFFRESDAADSPLAKAVDATLVFDSLAGGMAPELHPTLQQLAEICASIRGARRRLRIQRWLHGWLVLHIPVALATLVLLGVHVITVLRY